MIQLSVEANNKDTLHTSVAITSAKGMRRVLRQVFYQLLAPAVEKVDNAIHWINIYPVQWITQLVFLTRIRWIVIYPTDSAIQGLNNWGQSSPLLYFI